MQVICNRHMHQAFPAFIHPSQDVVVGDSGWKPPRIRYVVAPVNVALALQGPGVSNSVTLLIEELYTCLD